MLKNVVKFFHISYQLILDRITHPTPLYIHIHTPPHTQTTKTLHIHLPHLELYMLTPPHTKHTTHLTHAYHSHINLTTNTHPHNNKYGLPQEMTGCISKYEGVVHTTQQGASIRAIWIVNHRERGGGGGGGWIQIAYATA